MALVCVGELNTQGLEYHLQHPGTRFTHRNSYGTHVKITISKATTATDGEITASREPPRSTLRRRHRTRRIPTRAASRARTNRAASHPCSTAQSRKRSTRSWTTWRLEPHDRDGSMSRSLRSAMMMIFRRSEDWKERASRLHSAVALTSVVAARVQLGQHLELPHACRGRSGTRSSNCLLYTSPSPRD